MAALDTITDARPEAAKDIKLNVHAVLRESGMVRGRDCR